MVVLFEQFGYFFLQTDTAISSRLNGNKNEEKELEPWDAGQMNGNDNLSLELEASNGWDVQDMFRKNEQDYGVQSTFDHSLRGYTVALQTSDSPDYREAQAKAEQIANEIGLFRRFCKISVMK